MEKELLGKRIYFTDHEWSQIKEKSISVGFQPDDKYSDDAYYAEFIIKRFLSDDIVSKQNATKDIEKTLKGFVFAYENMSESPTQKIALEIYRGLLFKIKNEK